MLERNNDADAIEELRKTLTEHVMSNIRYAMILPRQMARMLINPIVKKYKHFFMEKMAEAMEYNLIKKGMVLAIILLTIYFHYFFFSFKKKVRLLNMC